MFIFLFFCVFDVLDVLCTLVCSILVLCMICAAEIANKDTQNIRSTVHRTGDLIKFKVIHQVSPLPFYQLLLAVGSAQCAHANTS